MTEYIKSVCIYIDSGLVVTDDAEYGRIAWKKEKDGKLFSAEITSEILAAAISTGHHPGFWEHTEAWDSPIDAAMYLENELVEIVTKAFALIGK
jgi:hypothetical protein